MKALVTATLAALAALSTAPPTMADDRPSVPWPEAVARIADLGRHYAGADAGWLEMIQIVGSDTRMREGYPGLEGWIDLVTALDPRFGEPYYLGAILLVTDDQRAEKVDALLARGEAQMPDDYTLPMWRGFSAYAGRLDPVLAATHYARAATKPKAPVYLGRLAERLARDGATCAGVMANLEDLRKEGHNEQGQTLFDERWKVLEHCFKKQIEAAAINFKQNHGRHATTVDELVDAGKLARPQAPNGHCWKVAFGIATMEPCP